MKKTWIMGLLILSNSVFGQIPGKSFDGPIVVFDTLTINKGDIIYLGNGSDLETGNFKYLYAPKNKTIPIVKDIISGFFSENSGFDSKAIPQQHLDEDFAGKQLVIESFSKISSKKAGKKILGVIANKDIQFIDGIYFNDVVVEFEPALRSGEIIKISAPGLAENAPEVEMLFSPFVITPNGIEPVIVAINSSKNELYNKAVGWANSYYTPQNQATIIPVPNEKIDIYDFAENVHFGTMLGTELYADLPYLFSVNFTDGEIRMTFTLGDENGDITDENGEVIANTSPSHMFNKNGEVLKMSKILKVEAEKTMNELSYAMVVYLLK